MWIYYFNEDNYTIFSLLFFLVYLGLGFWYLWRKIKNMNSSIEMLRSPKTSYVLPSVEVNGMLAVYCAFPSAIAALKVGVFGLISFASLLFVLYLHKKTAPIEDIAISGTPEQKSSLIGRLFKIRRLFVLILPPFFVLSSCIVVTLVGDYVYKKGVIYTEQLVTSKRDCPGGRRYKPQHFYYLYSDSPLQGPVFYKDTHQYNSVGFDIFKAASVLSLFSLTNECAFHTEVSVHKAEYEGTDIGDTLKLYSNVSYFFNVDVYSYEIRHRK